jgi:hypothetical protein
MSIRLAEHTECIEQTDPYETVVEKHEKVVGRRRKLKLNSVALVRKRTIPTERLPLDEVYTNFSV